MHEAPAERLRKPRILVVDDDAYLRQLVALVLGGHFEVETAEDGVDALAAVRRQVPDLVLLDVNMPRMNGWQACQEIRQISSVPIAMLTTSTRASEIDRGLALGVAEYITKPFSPRVLREHVEAILGRGANGQPG